MRVAKPSLPPAPKPERVPVPPAPKPAIPPAPKPTVVPAPAPAPAPIPSTSAAQKAVELDSILLPKTGPSILSAQRAPAAEVLKAANAPLVPSTPSQPLPPLTRPAEKNPDAVPVLQTYQSDVQKLMEAGVTLSKVVTAPKRKTSTALDQNNPNQIQGSDAEEAAARHERTLHRLELIGGVALIVGALGLLTVVFWHPSLGGSVSAPPVIQTPTSFIYVDDSKIVDVTPGEDSDALKTELANDKDSLQLSLGLVSEFFLAAQSTSSQPTQITTQQLFASLAPQAPDTLVRSLDPDFLFGVHAFDGNQPFLMFKTGAYSQAFAGMLDWEPTMQQDLAPLFTRSVSPHIPEEGTATPTDSTQFLQTPFKDRTVENHEARVIENDQGDILLLWTFLDPQTLVITTNEYTLREIVTRLSHAPTATGN